MMQPPPDVLPPANFSEGQSFDMTGGETFDLDPVIDPTYPWRYWTSADVMLAWRHGQAIPALFTSSPSPTTPLQVNGVPTALVLGQPTTTVLFGGNRVGNAVDIAGIVEMGMWLDQLKEVGIGVRGYAVAQNGGNFFATSDPTAGGPDLGRPFFNTLTGQQDAIPIAFAGPTDPVLDPGGFVTLNRGSVYASFSNQVYGGDLFGRVNWDRAPGYSVDLIGGYTYSRIDDTLIAGHTSVNLDPLDLIPDGSVFTAAESIRAKNNFNGISMGGMMELQSGRFTLKALGKTAFGNMHQVAIVQSQNQVMFNLPGNPVATLPGVLGNTGNFKRDQFCVVPEANITGGFQLTDNINLSLGYNFIYWSNVATAGNQAATGIAGPGNPTPFAFRSTDFWVQGMTFGVNGRF